MPTRRVGIKNNANTECQHERSRPRVGIACWHIANTESADTECQHPPTGIPVLALMPTRNANIRHQGPGVGINANMECQHLPTPIPVLVKCQHAIRVCECWHSVLANHQHRPQGPACWRTRVGSLFEDRSCNLHDSCLVALTQSIMNSHVLALKY